MIIPVQENLSNIFIKVKLMGFAETLFHAFYMCFYVIISFNVNVGLSLKYIFFLSFSEINFAQIYRLNITKFPLGDVSIYNFH